MIIVIGVVNSGTYRNFFYLYAFILLIYTIVPGINYFVVITHPLHQLQEFFC